MWIWLLSFWLIVAAAVVCHNIWIFIIGEALIFGIPIAVIYYLTKKGPS